MSIKRVVPVIPNPSLLIETKTERILVVGDLHIGWEISLMEKPELFKVLSSLIDGIKE